MPQRKAFLAFVRRQCFERPRFAQPGKVAVGLPELHPPSDISLGLRVALVERLAPPGEVLAEPFAGLPAPAGALLVIQRVRVPAVGEPRQHCGAGGVVADSFRHVLGEFWFCGERKSVEESSGGVEFLESAQLRELDLLGGVGRFLPPLNAPRRINSPRTIKDPQKDTHQGGVFVT